MIYLMRGVDNARTLGGITAADGRKIKENRLLRSAALSHPAPSDQAFLDSLGISLVVDFRSDAESEREPDVLPRGAAYRRLPVLPQLNFKAEETAHDADVEKTFCDAYDLMAHLEASDEAYRTFLNLVAEAEGCVLYHCSQGKDRTGLGTVLLLTALGVPMPAIRDDYLLTNSWALQTLEAMRRDGADEETIELFRPVMMADLSRLDVYEKAICRRCGGIEAYVRDVLGVDEAMRARLREKYTDPAS